MISPPVAPGITRSKCSTSFEDNGTSGRVNAGNHVYPAPNPAIPVSFGEIRGRGQLIKLLALMGCDMNRPCRGNQEQTLLGYSITLCAGASNGGGYSTGMRIGSSSWSGLLKETKQSDLCIGKEVNSLRLPDFKYLEPANLQEALELLATHRDQAAILAGGTDLVVRMKNGLTHPGFLISLKKVRELNHILEKEHFLTIGAMTPLASILESEFIRSSFPALYQATSLIGAPPIQRFRGTIGGNLCLDTRCLYYNKSSLWRAGRTRCHKDNGETCYAETNSDRCRSANQSDGACALMALNARIVLSSVRGERVLPIEEFFTGKGENPFALEADELVTHIRVPLPEQWYGSSFRKLTYRSAIDFALVSAAVWISVEAGKISAARIAVGGAGASPLLLKEAAGTLIGKSPSDNMSIDKTADQVRKHASAFMVDNLGSTLLYRQKMAGVIAKQAIRESLERIRI